MKTAPLVIERTIDAPVEKVWKAITDKNDMRKWYFDLEAFRPQVGFEFANIRLCQRKLFQWLDVPDRYAIEEFLEKAG